MWAAARRAALLLWAASTASTSWAAVPTTAGAHTAAASSTPDSRATITACQQGGAQHERRLPSVSVSVVLPLRRSPHRIASRCTALTTSAAAACMLLLARHNSCVLTYPAGAVRNGLAQHSQGTVGVLGAGGRSLHQPLSNVAEMRVGAVQQGAGQDGNDPDVSSRLMKPNV
jgi:hypothetical protein